MSNPTATAVAMPLTLGQQIANARKRAGLNQTQLGARWDVNLSTIGRFERDRGEPDFWMMVDLSDISGWPLDLFANAARRPEKDGPDDGPGGQNMPVITDGRSFACTSTPGPARLATVTQLQRQAA